MAEKKETKEKQKKIRRFYPMIEETIEASSIEECNKIAAKKQALLNKEQK